MREEFDRIGHNHGIKGIFCQLSKVIIVHITIIHDRVQIDNHGICQCRIAIHHFLIQSDPNMTLGLE